VWLCHEVKQTTWSGDKDIAAFGELLFLLTNWCTTVGNTRAKHRAIAETATLIEDLAAQLAGWGNDENQRLSSNCVAIGNKAIGKVGTRSSQFLGLSHELGQDRDEVCSGLAGA
jgi:hypothetical protein